MSANVTPKLKNLLSIRDLSDSLLEMIVHRALFESPAPRAFDPKKKSVALIFLEPSTRTRISFERAAHRTGRLTTFMEAKGSSVEKGESLKDTLLNLRALGLEIFVIRSPHTGALEELRDAGPWSLVNAGDGTGEHPTQALLDLCTLAKSRGGLDKLRGLKLGIIGDLRRSRVARSWGLLAPKVGIELRFFSPEAWKPTDWSAEVNLDKSWTHSKQKSLGDLDVVMALRIQKERMNTLDPEEAEDFVHHFQVSAADLRPDQAFMHPGPVNWGVELAHDLNGDPRSLILGQVEMGLSLRSVVLEILSGEA